MLASSCRFRGSRADGALCCFCQRSAWWARRRTGRGGTHLHAPRKYVIYVNSTFGRGFRGIYSASVSPTLNPELPAFQPKIQINIEKPHINYLCRAPRLWSHAAPPHWGSQSGCETKSEIWITCRSQTIDATFTSWVDPTLFLMCKFKCNSYKVI